MFHFCRCHKWALANGSTASLSCVSLWKTADFCFYHSPATQNPFPPLGDNESTVTQTPSTLKMKMSIWGGIERWEMRWWKKGRERWSNAEALRTWEEVVTWLGEKIRLILFESRYQLSERLFCRAGEMMAWEGSEIVGGWLRSLWASAWMKQPVMVLTPLKSFHKYA